MNYNERNNVFVSDNFQAQCKIALTDWLNYWATNGTASIEDETLREQTDNFLKFAVHNLDNYARALSVLVIGEESVKADSEVTDAEVSAAVNHVLSTALGYLI